ncbi:MAG: hypothetical protein J5973_00045 [Eubacterium sp.]|nr:hypothetical protein [Eubacterium sp.]
MLYFPHMEFNIDLAGVPIQIRCRHKESKEFLAGYLTDREAELTVEPTDADLRKVRLELEQMAERDGYQYTRISDTYLENNALHALIAEKIVPHGVLLFHGSALCMDGEAVIFTAPSGTGKSTQARIWREVFGSRVQMINDDKPLLRPENGKVMVYGSPWNGKHQLSNNIAAPLKAVLLVTRSESNYLEPLSGADAFQTMIRQGYRSENRLTRMQTLSMEMAIIETIPFYRLYCNLNPEAALAAWTGIHNI